MARIELAGQSLLYPREKRDAIPRSGGRAVHGLVGGSLKLLFEKKRARLAGPRVGAFWRLGDPA
jgi:hypothetical protein